jgi:hypothetical protein
VSCKNPPDYNSHSTFCTPPKLFGNTSSIVIRHVAFRNMSISDILLTLSCRAEQMEISDE